jgi:hypothetical protein
MMGCPAEYPSPPSMLLSVRLATSFVPAQHSKCQAELMR